LPGLRANLTGDLDVQFEEGREYRYEKVPRSKFRALMSAESVGAFVNEEIKPYHRYTEIAPHPRHAEILLLLSQCPAGRTAAELSTAIFGCPDHAVTVRAELSRLRGTLGGLIDHRPYRFPSWLDLACDFPADMASLLPHSTAPAIRMLRNPLT